MLFEAIEDGRVDHGHHLDRVERAHAMGGSRMFLETRDRPTTEDLIRGIAVLSGNDATVVVAEGLAGSEEAFARWPPARARAGHDQHHHRQCLGLAAPRAPDEPARSGDPGAST
jgi:serine-type D-Ala-D-Ala carboxypeptidase (penicillin-binding protein 5/6)